VRRWAGWGELGGAALTFSRYLWKEFIAKLLSRELQF